jgi:hypothetical protein
MQRARCPNDNHGRAVITVRFCCTCGSLVNPRAVATGCGNEKHGRMRRSQSAFCSDCGESLARSAARR